MMNEKDIKDRPILTVTNMKIWDWKAKRKLAIFITKTVAFYGYRNSGQTPVQSYQQRHKAHGRTLL